MLNTYSGSGKKNSIVIGQFQFLVMVLKNPSGCMSGPNRLTRICISIYLCLDIVLSVVKARFLKNKT